MEKKKKESPGMKMLIHKKKKLKGTSAKDSNFICMYEGMKVEHMIFTIHKKKAKQIPSTFYFYFILFIRNNTCCHTIRRDSQRNKNLQKFEIWELGEGGRDVPSEVIVIKIQANKALQSSKFLWYGTHQVVHV